MPFTGTFKNEAISLAFSSSSLSFKGFSICIIGISFFPFIHIYIFCLVLNNSVFISTLIASFTINNYLYFIIPNNFFSNYACFLSTQLFLV